MANNRMVLVCNICNTGISLAKYYPDGDGVGWYIPDSFNNEKVNDFFIRHGHQLGNTTFSGNQFRLGYEVNNNDWEYESIIN